MIILICNIDFDRDCAPGYQYKRGDVIGWGFDLTREASKEGCAERCTNTIGCNSYQYSPSFSLENCAIHAGGESDIKGENNRNMYMCFKSGNYAFDDFDTQWL